MLPASLTFLPTRLGMETSRPWMAMRIAVIALRNAAEVKMKMSSAVWPSDSRRSRRVIERFQDAIVCDQGPRHQSGRVRRWLLRLGRWRRIVRQLVLAG